MLGLDLLDTPLDSGTLWEVLLSAFACLVQDAFPRLPSGIVQSEGLVDVFPNRDSHHHVVGQVAQTAQSGVVLEQHLQDVLGAVPSDRVLRDHNSVQNVVLLQAMAKVNCEFIIKHVAVEVEVSYCVVGHEGVKQEGNHLRLEAVVAEV